MSATSWWISTALFFLSGAVGAFWALKDLGDPDWSDWIRPGPGHPWMGDAGRLWMFEAGPMGIRSLLLGVPAANIVQGGLLGLGSMGILMSPFRSNFCQFLTCALVPLEAWYYLINMVYLPLTGNTEAAIVVILLGGGLQGLCLWRLQSSLVATAPNTSRLLLNLYLAYALVAVEVTIAMIYRAPHYEAEMELFRQVRDFFLTENNMTWTKGLELPDGFYVKQRD